jgi:hypothetical protein
MNFSVYDETFTGDVLKKITLDINRKVITVADLIHLRVKKEIEEKADKFKELQLIDYSESSPLVDSESFDQIEKETKRRVKMETERALKAFSQNSFFVFIGDEQIQDLDFKISLATVQSASFIKLMPLVGG